MARQELFRREAVEGAASADGLGERFVVVRPRDRLGLSVLAALVFMALLWVVFGSVRVTVAGQGILLEPQAAAFVDGSGGDSAVLASLDQPQLVQRIAHLRVEISGLTDQGELSGDMRQLEAGVKQDSLDRQSAQVKGRVAALEALISGHEKASNRGLEQRKLDLGAQEKESKGLVVAADMDLKQGEKLKAQGALSESALTELRNERLAAQTRLDTVRAALEALSLEAVNSDVSRLELQERLERLQAERDDLRVAGMALQRELYEARSTSSNAVADLQRQLEAAELELSRRRSGSNADEGEPTQADEGLLVVCFMDTADAKRVTPGMTMRVSPDSVEAERFGSAVGRVRDVTTYPVTPDQAEVLLGNETLAGRLAESGRSVILVGALDPAETASGVMWTTSAGPPHVLSPGTTLTAEVIVEKRRPISWLLPWLRKMAGVR